MPNRSTFYSPHSTHSRSAGFSFTEVLFAVMLLGIGFIMIAAVFPVAIQQNQATLQETTAQAVANDAINQLRNLSVTYTGTGQVFGTTGGTYVAINVPVWSRIYGLNFINSADSRFAWVAFYSRNNGENDARLIILVLQNHNSTCVPPLTNDVGDTYTPASSTPGTYSGPPVVPGSLVNDAILNTSASQSASVPSVIGASGNIPIMASVFYNADGTSSITMSALDVTSANPPVYSLHVPWAVPGAFAIVGYDTAKTMTGRVLRLGQTLAPNDPNWNTQFGGSGPAGLDAFQLVPGFDLRQDQSEYRSAVANTVVTTPNPLYVFVVGTPTNPAPFAPMYAASAPFDYELVGSATGVAQDIAVFTATIPCK